MTNVHCCAAEPGVPNNDEVEGTPGGKQQQGELVVDLQAVLRVPPPPPGLNGAAGAAHARSGPASDEDMLLMLSAAAAGSGGAGGMPLERSGGNPAPRGRPRRQSGTGCRAAGHAGSPPHPHNHQHFGRCSGARGGSGSNARRQGIHSAHSDQGGAGALGPHRPTLPPPLHRRAGAAAAADGQEAATSTHRRPPSRSTPPAPICPAGDGSPACFNLRSIFAPGRHDMACTSVMHSLWIGLTLRLGLGDVVTFASRQSA